MGCLITSGRKVHCKSAVGGIKTIYFADYGTLGDVTIVAGEITAVTGAVEFFQFDVKGNSSICSGLRRDTWVPSCPLAPSKITF